MEKDKKLSIIIPTWNTSKITLKCIQTIQKYLLIDSTEVIVVDNGSTDDTQKIFSKIREITYIRNLSNLGFSKGNNIGAKKANGKYLLFLNSDMELVDTSLLSMVNYLENNPNIGIIGPKFLNADMSEQGSVTPLQTPLNAINEYWLHTPHSFSKYIPNSTTPIKVPNISGGAVLVSKELFNIIGGWDERYYFYFEDLELCRQVRKLKKEIYYFPECRVIHRHGASGTDLANTNNQWKRLIPSSKIFHGLLEHYLIFLIIWSSQKIFRQSP